MIVMGAKVNFGNAALVIMRKSGLQMPRYISLGVLLTKWWQLPGEVNLGEIYHMDFDELAAFLEIECPDAHNMNVQVSNVNIDRRGLVWITFSTGRRFHH